MPATTPSPATFGTYTGDHARGGAGRGGERGEQLRPATYALNTPRPSGPRPSARWCPPTALSHPSPDERSTSLPPTHETPVPWSDGATQWARTEFPPYGAGKQRKQTKFVGRPVSRSSVQPTRFRTLPIHGAAPGHVPRGSSIHELAYLEITFTG